MKIGLFVCRCGPNIGRLIRRDELLAGAGWPADVVAYDTPPILCSEEGRAWMGERLAADGIDRVVVAGCSPREHEATFRGVLEDAGRNPYLLQLTNIRELGEWLSSDPDSATARARDQVAAALARVRQQQELQATELACDADVLVVGGGVAGLSAALTLAQKQRRVTVVEQDHVLGGLANLLDKIYPDMECASCVLDPVLEAVLHHPDIQVITGAEPIAVLGSLGNFKVTLRRRPRQVDPESCIGCASCAAACPVAPLATADGTGTRRAIYLPYPGCLPNASVVDSERCLHFVDDSCAACVEICPMDAIHWQRAEDELQLSCGAIVLCTGLDHAGHDHRFVAEVIDGLQAERLLHPNGPTAGALTLSDGRSPEAVLLVVDEAPAAHQELAWRQVLKLALLIRERTPSLSLELLLPSVDAHGPWRNVISGLAADGVRLTRGVPTGAIYKVGDRLRLGHADNGRHDESFCDLAVIVGALNPARSNEELAAMLRLELDDWGFIKERRGLFEATATSTEGVLVAGCAAGPKSVHDSVRDAMAAAGRVLAKLVPGATLHLEPTVSVIDEERCSGCRLCSAQCPYGALSYDRERAVTRVLEAYCHGCGSCAAACPSGAIDARHYSDRQILAELGGLLHDRSSR